MKKTVSMTINLDHDIERVWAIFSDVTRSDWVPAVDHIELAGDIRSFSMAGIGEVQERILKLDHGSHCLQYSAIKTPSAVEHHLATIQLSALDSGCQLSWTTEILPEAFAEAIEQAMAVSVDCLQEVLKKS